MNQKEKEMNTISEVEFMDIFGDNLRDLMEDGRWTQKELSEDSNVSQAAISGYLNKTKMPGIRSIQNICMTLGVPLSDILPYGGIIRIE